MPVLLANNATSLLAGAIDAAATTLSVENADAALFPNPAAGEWFPLTIVDNAGNMEIVKATARAGAIITVQRAQEGTTAKAFAAGARVDLRATAAALNDVGEKATTKTVGAAMAGANGKQTPADGDFFGGVEAGGSTMFKTTWGNIKAALAAIFYSKTEVNNIVGGNMSGRAYPRRSDGGALNFIWSGQARNPGYVWGIDEPGGNAYPHPPANLSVAWANGAGYADRLGPGGWTLATVQDQLNWRVTDTRFDGYIAQEARTTGSPASTGNGASGYVVTFVNKRAGVEVLDIGLRQPQRYIPNQGWRALGGW